MTNNRYIKEIPRALLIGLGIFFIILLIQIINNQKIEWNENLKLLFFYTLLYTLSLHLANTWLFNTLDQIFANQRFSKKRIFIGFISSFVLSLIVIFLLRLFEEVVINKQPLLQFIQNEKAANYLLSSIFTFIVLLIIHFIYIYKALQENKVKEQKIIAGTASAKFESLKNQIDPHFLFNSLNVLSSLIEENPENAQRFTTSLSKIYRYVLEQKDKDLIPINEELDFAKTYMNLLKMRFENSLTYEISIDSDLAIPEMKVVPLSLQLLLENTVKHNVVTENKPLHIKIYNKINYLCIENNLQKKENLNERQGVGLQNIINRYNIITKRKVMIEQTENAFIVQIPILTKQLSIMETENNYSENTAYFRAKKRVEELKGFYGNLTAYCIVIPLLIFINLTTDRHVLWFFYPMLGWGMGLTFHGLSVFGYSKSWEERKIQEIMNRNNAQNNQYK
jgi:sensor histidine kinase YesM